MPNVPHQQLRLLQFDAFTYFRHGAYQGVACKCDPIEPAPQPVIRKPRSYVRWPQT